MNILIFLIFEIIIKNYHWWVLLNLSISILIVLNKNLFRYLINIIINYNIKKFCFIS